MKTVLFLLISAISMLAQSQHKVAITNMSPAAGQHEIMPLTVASLSHGERACAPYFVKYNGPAVANSTPELLFKFSVSNKEIGIMGMMSKSKFTTIIDGTKKVPTIEMVSREGVINKNTRVVVRLSKQDYERSKDCLPKP